MVVRLTTTCVCVCVLHWFVGWFTCLLACYTCICLTFANTHITPIPNTHTCAYTQPHHAHLKIAYLPAPVNKIQYTRRVYIMPSLNVCASFLTHRPLKKQKPEIIRNTEPNAMSNHILRVLGLFLPSRLR